MSSNRKHVITRFIFCIIPILVTCILVFIFRNSISLIMESDFGNIVEISIGLEGTLLGFIITAVSILVAFNGSKLTDEVKKTGHFKTVLLVYLVTCFELLISIVYSMCIIISKSFDIICMRIFMAMLILSAFYVLLCLFFLCLIVYTLFN